MTDSTTVTSTPTLPDSDPEYIIDNIMPAHEIHLLGGPSGAGKTTLAFQMIRDIREGRPVFGYATHSIPICYVSCDRSSASAVRTAARVGVNDIPTIIAKRGHRNIRQVIEDAKALVPNLRLLVIDAIGVLVPGGKINDYGAVMDFLGYCTELCELHHITILAMGHATKTKEGEGFIDPRHKFLGSVAWGGSSDTMLYIESSNPKDPDDPSRRIIVLPRNYPASVLAYTFNNRGHLIPVTEADDELTLDVKLLNVQLGVEVTTSTITGWGFPASRSTINRWILDAVRTGKLEQVKKGVYRRPRPS
jgi:RecA-family ATPase